MTKYSVALDGDGHFMLAKLTDRSEVIKNLKQIHDGDYWANDADDYMDEIGVSNENELLSLDEDKWVSFVSDFIQRGTMEIIEI